MYELASCGSPITARIGPRNGDVLPSPVRGKARMRRIAVRHLALTALVILMTIPGCGERGVATEAVFGVPTQPNSMDPLTAPDIYSRWATELVYDGLVDVNERLEVVPALAASWEASADGLVWTFNLRRDVRWRDGTLLTAADVLRTYEAILDPSAAMTLPRSDYQGIALVETPDAFTLRFTLRQPDASLLSKLTVGIARPGPARAPASEQTESPEGAGPFVLQEWLPGQRLVFAANRGYYGGAPGLDRLTWQVVPDASALLLLLQSDGIDGALVETPQEADRLTAGGKLRAYPVDGGNLQVSLRLTDPLFQDVRVRRSLALAVNRRGMISGLVQGRGILSAGDILPVSWAFSAAAASVNLYDPAEARRLLLEAGWLPDGDGVLAKDGRRLAFTLFTDTGSQLRREVALVLRQDWQAVGAAVDLQFMDRNTLVVERVLRGRFQAALLQSSARVDPDLSRRFHSRAIASGQNFLGYENPVVDSLLDRALLAPTPASRALLYQEAQMLLARDLPQIDLFYPTLYYVVRADIGGIRPSAMGPFWNVEEWGR
jgi:peptide/nickel transport system substrate-binding protein